MGSSEASKGTMVRETRGPTILGGLGGRLAAQAGVREPIEKAKTFRLALQALRPQPEARSAADLRRQEVWA